MRKMIQVQNFEKGKRNLVENKHMEESRLLVPHEMANQ